MVYDIVWKIIANILTVKFESMDIKIVSYSPGPFEICDRFHELKKEMEVNVEAMPQIRFSQKSDFIGFQIDINFWADNEVAIKFGFLIGMVVEGWTEAFSKGENPQNDKNIIKALCERAWLVGTGLLIARSNDKFDKSIILPDIELDKFADDVYFTDITSKS